MKSILDSNFSQAPAAGETCEVTFTTSQLLQLCVLQDEANTVMSSEAWRESTDDTLWYYRAINNELAECSTHIGIKWWKNEHPTEEIANSAYAQAKMEVVDILHFALSNFIREAYLKDDPLDLAVRHFKPEYPALYQIGRFSYTSQRKEHLNPDYKDLTINDFVEQCQFANLSYGSLDLAYVLTLAECLGMTSEDLYIAYVGKNVLNKFRTSNGQREGTYLKIWNGVEDNEYLTEHLKVGLASGTSPNVEALLSKLDTQYQTFLSQDLCTRG